MSIEIWGDIGTIVSNSNQLGQCWNCSAFNVIGIHKLNRTTFTNHHTTYHMCSREEFIIA